jgi:hypothetical protein
VILSLSHVTFKKKSKKPTNRRTNKIPRTNLEFHQSEKRRVFSNPDKSRKEMKKWRTAGEMELSRP